MEKIKVQSIDVSSIKKSEQETQLIVKEAQGIVIKTQADYIIAGELRKRIKGKIKEIDERRKSLTLPLDGVKKSIMAMFNPMLELLEKGVARIDNGVIAYSEEQDRKAREAQAKADEEARKEREKAESRAKELEAKGKFEKAQAMQDKADNIIAPVITSAAPKISGQTIKEMWDFEIIDIDIIPRQYLIPNEVLLRKTVSASSGKILISGIKIFSKKIVSGRSS